MSELIWEILTEEIPSRLMQNARKQMRNLVVETFEQHFVTYASIDVNSTPCRLTLHVNNLPLYVPKKTSQIRGPRVGCAPSALRGFCVKYAIDENQLKQTTLPHGQFWTLDTCQGGQETVVWLQNVCLEIMSRMKWDIEMRWGNGHDVWARPIRLILCVFNGQHIKWTWGSGDVQISTVTHTFGQHKINETHSDTIKSWHDYTQFLTQEGILLNVDARRQHILTTLENIAKKNHAVLDERDVRQSGLLDEVTDMVDHPHVIAGHLPEVAHTLPQILVQTVLRVHQKFFVLFQNNKTHRQLSDVFLGVSNTEDVNGWITKGYERVVDARLQDAAYFYQQDRKDTQEGMMQRLQQRQLFDGLGSMAMKAQRLHDISLILYPQDVHLHHAALQCKNDLASQIISEFPELQGHMGALYAAHAGSAPEVCEAIAQHYAPHDLAGIFQDIHALSQRSCILAMIDRLDTLVGFAGLKRLPSGSKDPFALRRAGIGFVQLMTSIQHWSHAFQHLVAVFIQAYEMRGIKFCENIDAIHQSLHDFLFERVKFCATCPLDVFQHLVVHSTRDLRQIWDDAHHLHHMMQNDASVFQAMRRLYQFCTLHQKNSSFHCEYDVAILQCDAEIALHQAYIHVKTHENWIAQMHHLAPYIDQFFNDVQINVDDATLTQNRVHLLCSIYHLFNARFSL